MIVYIIGIPVLTLLVHMTLCNDSCSINLEFLQTLIVQDKVAKEGQSGKTAFSQGGVNGPNKLEGLVGYGNLKPGPSQFL